MWNFLLGGSEAKGQVEGQIQPQVLKEDQFVVPARQPRHGATADHCQQILDVERMVIVGRDWLHHLGKVSQPCWASTCPTWNRDAMAKAYVFTNGKAVKSLQISSMFILFPRLSSSFKLTSEALGGGTLKPRRGAA